MQLQVAKVRVVRAFYYDKKPVKVDTVVELPKIFAAEMVAANKAEYEGEPLPAAPDKGAAKGKLV